MNLLELIEAEDFEAVYNENHFTKEEFDYFINQYEELSNLRHFYQNTLSGRKEIRENITYQTKLLSKYLKTLSSLLECDNIGYTSITEKFQDYKTPINIIKDLLGSNYKIKNIDILQRYKGEVENYEASVLVRKDIKLNKRTYNLEEIDKIFETFIENDIEFVFGTDIFKRPYFDKLSIINIREPFNLVCNAPKNSELNRTIDKLLFFVSINGYDLNDTNRDVLINFINQYYEENRGKVKTKA